MCCAGGSSTVVLDSAGVTDGSHRKLAKDTLNGNDVQDRFLVVKLVTTLEPTDSNHPMKQNKQ